MDKEESWQEPELCYAVVGTAGSLQAFFSGDADANVSLLAHGNIVASIADGESDGSTKSSAKELGEQGFLAGGGAAINHCIGVDEEVEEGISYKRLSFDRGQGLAGPWSTAG